MLQILNNKYIAEKFCFTKHNGFGMLVLIDFFYQNRFMNEGEGRKD